MFCLHSLCLLWNGEIESKEQSTDAFACYFRQERDINIFGGA